MPDDAAFRELNDAVLTVKKSVEAMIDHLKKDPSKATSPQYMAAALYTVSLAVVSMRFNEACKKAVEELGGKGESGRQTHDELTS